MEKDFKRERQRCLYQHNQKSDLKVTHFNFWIFLNELQLIILYLGLSQYYAEPLIHGRVDLELDLDNAEAILRVIGNLHSDQNNFSVVANICLRSETKENFVMRQGNM